MFWIVVVVVAVIAVTGLIAVTAFIAFIAVVGWRSRARFSGVPRETGEQRRWKDDGKASYIGHGF
jgi:hypothetical protein